LTQPYLSPLVESALILLHLPTFWATHLFLALAAFTFLNCLTLIILFLCEVFVNLLWLLLVLYQVFQCKIFFLHSTTEPLWVLSFSSQVKTKQVLKMLIQIWVFLPVLIQFGRSHFALKQECSLTLQFTSLISSCFQAVHLSQSLT